MATTTGVLVEVGTALVGVAAGGNGICVGVGLGGTVGVGGTVVGWVDPQADNPMVSTRKDKIYVLQFITPSIWHAR